MYMAKARETSTMNFTYQFKLIKFNCFPWKLLIVKKIKTKRVAKTGNNLGGKYFYTYVISTSKHFDCREYHPILNLLEFYGK